MLEFTSQCTLQERHIAVPDQSRERTRQSKITECFEGKLLLGVSAGIVLSAHRDWLSGSLVRCGGKHQIRERVLRAGCKISSLQALKNSSLLREALQLCPLSR